METNNGGIVVALVLLVSALSLGLIGSLYLYVLATQAPDDSGWAKRLLRLLSGWANISNALVHALLTVFLLFADTENLVDVPDADNRVGPVCLLLVNGAIGVQTVTGQGGPLLPFCWNTFVAIAGSLVPMVWPKFIAQGLETWPYTIVFLWLGIYAFESIAFFTSLALFFLSHQTVPTARKDQ